MFVRSLKDDNPVAASSANKTQENCVCVCVYSSLKDEFKASPCLIRPSPLPVLCRVLWVGCQSSLSLLPHTQSALGCVCVLDSGLYCETSKNTLNAFSLFPPTHFVRLHFNNRCPHRICIIHGLLSVKESSWRQEGSAFLFIPAAHRALGINAFINKQIEVGELCVKVCL